MIRTAAVWACGLLLACPTARAQDGKGLTRDQMDEDLKELGAVIRRAYAYCDEKKEQYGVDPDRLVADARKRLGGVKSDAEFHDLLREVVAGLRDGHCEVLAPHLARSAGRHWPFLVHRVKEGVVVTGIDPSLAGAGIDRGDLILEVNGRPIKDWVEDAGRVTSASTDGARRKLALERVVETSEERLRVTVEHPNGKRATVTVKTGQRLAPSVEPSLYDPPDAGFATGRALKGGVGYVRVPSFGWDTPEYRAAKTDAERDAATKPARDKIDAAFAAVAGTESLVLDLRGNGGGRDVLGAYLLSHLLAGDFVYYTTQKRSSPDLRAFAPSPLLPASDGWAAKYSWEPRKTVFSFFKGKTYPGPVAVLINEASFSTTDCVAAVLADLHPRVRYVGRPTNGGAGDPTVVARLPNSKAEVQLCVMRVWSPKGHLIEGHGTRPDVAVEWTREDVLKNRDPDLEAALRR